MSRPTRLQIDKNALLHNLKQVKKYAPEKKIIAMVKSNAYGCGVASVVPTLVGHVDAFGVACIEEAMFLRSLEQNSPCILFQGVFNQEEYHLAAENKLSCVVHTIQQVEWLLKANLATPIQIWIKVNTGLNRLGFLTENINYIFEQLSNCLWVEKISLMTHFARADEPENAYNAWQIYNFENISLPKQNLECSLSNSAAIISQFDCKEDFVRPGIMIYGVSPFALKNGSEFGLIPVMSLQSEITAINKIPSNTYIGYGGTWRSERDSVIGVVPVGYGDGYPRHIMENTLVAVGGYLAPIVGRISMDMMTIDLTNCPGVEIGDTVELWGKIISIEIIARSAGTIAYELMCQVSNRVRSYN